MHEIKLDITPAQLKKLHKGQGVIIKPAQIGSGHSVMMGKVKMNKLIKGKDKEKGTKLQLSAEEIKKNSKEGDGVFSKLLMQGAKSLGKVILGEVKKKAKEKAKEVAVKQGKKLAKKGVDKVAKKVGEKNKALGDIVKDVGDKGVDMGADVAKKKLDEKIGKGRVRKPTTIKSEVVSFEGDGLMDDLKANAKKLAKTAYDKYGDDVKKAAKKQGKKIAKKGVKAVAKKAGKKSPFVGSLIQEHGDMLVDEIGDKAYKGNGTIEGGSFRPFGKFLTKYGKKVGKYALPVAMGAAGNFIGGPLGAAALSGATSEMTKGWGVEDTQQIKFGKGMDTHGNPLVAGNYNNFLPESAAYIPTGNLNVNQTISGYAQHGSGIYANRSSGNGLYASARRRGNGAPIPKGTYNSYAM